MKKDKPQPLPHTIHKNNFRWMAGLNIKAKAIKLLEENIGEYRCELGVGKDFLGYKKH